MKIYDEANERLLQAVVIYLTPEEMHELADWARNLVEKPELHHSHIISRDFGDEMTISIYTDENLAQFDTRSRKILGDDSLGGAQMDPG